ncbi:C40 family peptidase [Nonomuraea lactucae]|uniref:C40 family peptidase n=1 Tax=Nonomuraea lactucae TaxID=2249762 RepID=UPI0013B36275|nr:C40 family peptidase [Nonomuraea lactucae]
MTTGLAAAGLTLAAPAAAGIAPGAAAATPDPGGITLTGNDVKRIRTRDIRLPAWKVALDYAMDKRGTPYVWGGASESGYDCSGLMLRAYQAAGISLPRTAASQYHAFSRKISWDRLKPGDLVFFSGLGHMGMISRPGYMVHSPHTGDVVKEERLNEWRRNAFVGAVRPDPKGVKRWAHIRELRRAPAPVMPVATL